jgi:hypothetical protein
MYLLTYKIFNLHCFNQCETLLTLATTFEYGVVLWRLNKFIFDIRVDLSELFVTYCDFAKTILYKF